MDNKLRFFIAIICVFTVLISIVSAINLEVEHSSEVPTLIKELDTEVAYDISIKNNAEGDTFNIYSLVGIEMLPKESFYVYSGASEKIKLRAIPSKELKDSTEGYLNFNYKIKGKNTGIQEETLTMKIISLSNAFFVGAENLDPESETIKVYMINLEDRDVGDITAVFSSAFFEEEKSFRLGPKEKYEFEVMLDRQKMKKIFAGGYPLTVEFKALGIEAVSEGNIRFLEKPGLASSQLKTGLIIKKLVVEKENIGNVLVNAEVNTTKDIITRLFTSITPTPTGIQRNGFTVYYEWKEELNPGEVLKVDIVTNYTFPLILLGIVLIIIFVVKFYTHGTLELNKKVKFVKTKGGEFALKVSLKVTANAFLEKISVIDRIPKLVKVHEKFLGVKPDKIDEKNRRIIWEIPELQKGEHRVLSYFVYSKIAVMGRFELPSGRAVYEKNGKVKEASSNKAYFINEPREKEPED